MKSKSAVLLTSSARTATPAAINLNGDFTSKGSSVSFIEIDPAILKNFHIIVDVTAIVTTPSIVVSIEASDEASDTFYPLLTSQAITSISKNVLKVGVDMIESSESSSDFIPKKARIVITHANADSITYSVGINYQEN